MQYIVYAALAVYATLAVHAALAVLVLFVIYIPVNRSGHFGMTSNSLCKLTLSEKHFCLMSVQQDQEVTGTIIWSSIILLWKISE